MGKNNNRDQIVLTDKHFHILNTLHDNLQKVMGKGWTRFGLYVRECGQPRFYMPALKELISLGFVEIDRSETDEYVTGDRARAVLVACPLEMSPDFNGKLIRRYRPKRLEPWTNSGEAWLLDNAMLPYGISAIRVSRVHPVKRSRQHQAVVIRSDGSWAYMTAPDGAILIATVNAIKTAVVSRIANGLLNTMLIDPETLWVYEPLSA